MDHARREAIELAARIATRQTFGPFYGEPDSPFYEAEGLSPEETWERLAEKLALVTAHAILQGLENQTLHRGLLRLGMPRSSASISRSLPAASAPAGSRANSA